MIKYPYKGFELSIEEDGKALPSDITPEKALQSMMIKISVYKDGILQTVVTRFGYSDGGSTQHGLAAPFTNLQRFLVKYEKLDAAGST